MLETINSRAASVGGAVVTASRQVWLAGLGAAVVSRDWAEKEAGTVFRKLVREGTTVESRAFRVVGDRLDGSFIQANALWKRARHSFAATVRTCADTAAILVREKLSAALPKVAASATTNVKPAAKRPVKRARKATTARPAVKPRAKRTAKTPARRG